MQSRWARVARGAGVACFSTGTAAFAHVLGGGEPPSVFALVIALVFSISTCVLLTGRLLSLPRLTVSVAISQALFHALFSGMGAPTAVGHQHSPTVAMDATDATSLSAGHASMWVTHAVTAMATFLIYRYAERAYYGLATTAGLLVRRVVEAQLAAPSPLRRPSAPAVAVEQLPSARGTVCSGLRYRGPPSVSAAA